MILSITSSKVEALGCATPLGHLSDSMAEDFVALLLELDVVFYFFNYNLALAVPKLSGTEL